MEDKIFSVTDQGFEGLALEIFHFQYRTNHLYQSWVNALSVDPAEVQSIQQIPFLPISFFKSHQVKSTEFVPVAFFESSGTTGTINSRHYLKDISLYKNSFLKCFELFYGQVDQLAILGLLPSYLERKNSSLVMMVEELILRSKKQHSGFYLYDHEKLQQALVDLDRSGQPALLIGVTFALLDFAEKFQLKLDHVMVMETGGMKGRREELTRQEVHARLKEKLGVQAIQSEYGMTELLSQAYAKANGIFHAPPWMKILVREEEDPLKIKSSIDSQPVKGALNFIDLANLYSCSFIATEDLGTLYSNRTFTVEGRLDKSDLRGCSLLAI